LSTVLLILLAGAVANAVETFVTFDIVTPDPNDPNYTAPLIEAEPGQQISYSITAIVQAVDPNDEPNLGAGLGAAYVTLNTNFADPNCVGAATQVCSTLSLYPCTGLVLGDDVTDIGGSHDLLNDTPTPNAFANGYKVVIASGTLTAPTADGVYHVWVTPQQASILGPNLTQAPFGSPPDHTAGGQGFYVVIGNYYYYTLTVWSPAHFLGNTYGYVEQTPNLPSYPNGMEVTLTAIPQGGKHFEQWYHYDVNVPFDANHWDDPNYNTFTTDANNPITVVMDQNRLIVANFECGSGMVSMVATATVAIFGGLWLMRRRR
jgi:hypothetical protein